MSADACIIFTCRIDFHPVSPGPAAKYEQPVRTVWHGNSGKGKRICYLCVGGLLKFFMDDQFLTYGKKVTLIRDDTYPWPDIAQAAIHMGPAVYPCCSRVINNINHIINAITIKINAPAGDSMNIGLAKKFNFGLCGVALHRVGAHGDFDWPDELIGPDIHLADKTGAG